jgi:hypothetical protein
MMIPDTDDDRQGAEIAETRRDRARSRGNGTFSATNRKATCPAVSYTVRERMMAGHTKRATVFLAALLMGAVAAPSVASAAATTPNSSSDMQTAVVRVQIEQPDGKTLRATKVVQWGAKAEFDLSGHDLDVTVSDRTHLDVSYTRDGSKVTDKQVDAEPRKAIVIHDDAGAKITIKIIPTKVHVETSPL